MPTKSQIIAYAVQMAGHYNVPANIVLGVIQHESDFQADVTSVVGAIGLMQLMPATAKTLGVNPKDWQQNIEGGVHYLQELYREESNWKDTLAAYGWGPGNAQSPHAQAAAQDVLNMAKSYVHYNDVATSVGGRFNLAHWMGSYKNGYVPEGALVQIGNGTAFGQPIAMRPDAAASFMAMVTAAKRDGVDLLPSLQNGYRSYSVQQGLWTSSNHGTTHPVASPGNSNHGLGIAADISSGTAGWAWIKAHGAAYGWLNDVPGDVPHFDYKPNPTQQATFISEVRRTGGSYIVSVGGRALPASMGGSQVSTQELQGVLRGFGLNPNIFGDLIHQAVTQGWNSAELAAAVYNSQEFHNSFPGIFNADGSLKMTPAEYTQVAFGQGGYADIARNAGVKLGRQGIGTLIGSDVSPDEWAFRARVLHMAQSSEVYRQQFNAVLKASGQSEIDKGQWFNHIAGQTDPRIENMYEAVALTGAKGLDVKPKDALHAAGQIGDPGQAIDVKALLGQIHQVKDFVAPELRAAGISDADLAVLESGADPKNIKGSLDQILRSRQAQVALRVTGNSPGQGLYPSVPVGV